MVDEVSEVWLPLKPNFDGAEKEEVEVASFSKWQKYLYRAVPRELHWPGLGGRRESSVHWSRLEVCVPR